uniref:dihydropyrimidinase n=1 Tax=Macrostomum lignano TaxID=282301 RepID=A0A1I8GB02_9PLAT
AMNDSKVQVGIKKVPLHLQSAQNRLLIKGGRIVNDDGVLDADVYIEDGLIKQVGCGLMTPGGVRVIDAAGMLVMPGKFGLASSLMAYAHTRFQMPFMDIQSADDFYTGTRAALAGGTTTVIDTVACERDASMVDWFNRYRAWADEKACCDYGLRVVVPQWSGQKTADEMAALVKEHGINAFHCHMSYPGVWLLEDDELLSVFQTCRRLGALAQVHAENGKGIYGPEGHAYSRPERMEVEATVRALCIADAANCPLYVLPVTSPEAADAIACARRTTGQACFGEVSPAALACDDSVYQHPSWRFAAGHVTNPPLRDASAKAALAARLGGLNCGQPLAVCASGHCAYKSEQRALGRDDFRKIPPGINGVEDRLSVVWETCVETGAIDPCQFVAVTSANAAKLFNIYPQKGRIAVGSDADVIVWNPAISRTISAKAHHETSDFSVFDGFACHGVPEFVISGGRLAVDERQLRVTQGVGRFVSMPPFGMHAYGRVDRRERAKAASQLPVTRAAYDGPVVELKSDQASAPTRPSNPIAHDDFRQRPPTRGGGRDMQESSFSLSGAQFDDKRPSKSGIRTNQPPGGASSGSLW